MPEDLNSLAALQLKLAGYGMQFDALAMALHSATTALADLAEEAVARGEYALAEQAMDAVDQVADTVRPFASST